MTTHTKQGDNPFAKRTKVEFSRRVFSQGLFFGGAALAAMPMGAAGAANVAISLEAPATGSLREVIDAQVMAFEPRASLGSAAQDEAFHEFLGRKLNSLRPASAS